MIRSLLCLVLVAASVTAQSPTPARALLDAVIARVERCYAAYVLEVVDDERRVSAYRAHCRTLRERAEAAAVEDCLPLLEDYVAWFDDGHLFVQDLPRHTPEQLQAFARTTPKRPINGLVERLRANERQLDPIEGLWFTTTHEIAVERTAPDAATFVAVVLETDEDGWQPGHVLAEFERTAESEYEAVLRRSDHSPRRAKVVLQRLFLRMPPAKWGRRWPLPAHDRDLLHDEDPLAPCFRVIDDGATLITLPSLSPRYKKELQRLCVDHRDQITTRDLLLVDVRCNGGGSSVAARPLAPFYHTEKRAPRPYAGAGPHVLSSPETLQYYERIKGGFFTPRWLSSIRKRLAAQPGELIPLFEGSNEYSEYTPRRSYDQPRHVAIVTDEHVGSAGEAFVLEARRYGKVRVFGRPTRGMIDYQNVLMVAVAAAGVDRQVVLGFPVVAASNQLPEGGHNRTGVLPDVHVGDDVVDWLAWVREQYR